MAEKSKIGVPFRKARFVVKYGYGIDPLPTLISAAINKPCQDPIIKVEGNKSIFSYNLGDGTYSQKFKGLAAIQKYLSENHEEAIRIANQISPDWGECISGFRKQSLEALQESEEDTSEDI